MRVNLFGALLAISAAFLSACATQTTSNPEDIEKQMQPVSATKFCWDGSRPALGICPQMPSVTVPPKPFDPKTRPGPDNPDKIGFMWCFDGTGLTYNAYMAGQRCQPVPVPEKPKVACWNGEDVDTSDDCPLYISHPEAMCPDGTTIPWDEVAKGATCPPINIECPDGSVVPDGARACPGDE